MVKQLRESPGENRRPAPMLESELSAETLDAIKAIVSAESDEATPLETQSAIVEAISAHPDFAAANDDMVPMQSLENSKRQDKPDTLILTEKDQVEVVDAPEATEPKVDMDLIRQTIVESAKADPIPQQVEDPVRAPEEEIIKPPSVFLRLKRHIRNKLRMHFLIAKMKVRDMLPTKREVIRSMTPRRLAIVVILTAILLKPWFLPTVLVLATFTGAFVVLAMGPDRTRHYAGLLWKRFKRKNPEKATEISARMMARFEIWQSLVDRLPSRWTQGLHLPQTQSEEEKYAADSAYASRMARIAQDETVKSYS